ncbi:hypothetical protein CEXT_633781 [Caerostris extrusa]|uniref:Ribosomal protein S14 n=1 Tax=Caerostris extrusa TaxID=172846 RepID=A0AAV4UNT8_CAEEX|nr:hypothetical protein CEXT_633781 [Caerostris extrusa]
MQAVAVTATEIRISYLLTPLLKKYEEKKKKKNNEKVLLELQKRRYVSFQKSRRLLCRWAYDTKEKTSWFFCVYLWLLERFWRIPFLELIEPKDVK